MKEQPMSFISENTYRLHKEYLNTLRLRYSILIKSEPRLFELSIPDIKKYRRIKSDIKEEAIALYSQILSHELYFSSFGASGARSDAVRAEYGSESSFLYTTMRSALNFGEGYCFIIKSGGGIFAQNTKSPSEIYQNDRITPKLCIDLYEHAYFRDYGFEREEYLSAALFHLNLSVL